MKDVKIRIYDTDNNVLGDLDLSSSDNFPLALTLGIINLDNLVQRTGSYSKSFNVPNTKNNAKLLSNIDNINSRKDYRDSLGRKPCAILVNNNIINKGFVKVETVKDGFEVDSFELVFFGNNIDWVKDAGELKLSDINFRNNNQIYNKAAITNSWISDSDTYDHVYPYISRGGNAVRYNTQVEDYTPVFYLRSLFERGLNQLGWNLNSSFLEDSIIKRLVCDFSLKFFIDEDSVLATKSRASRTSNTVNIARNTVQRVVFNDDSTPPNEDDNGHYNTTTGVYTVPESSTYNFSGVLSTNSSVNLQGFQNTNYRLFSDILLVVNGTSETNIGTGYIYNQITNGLIIAAPAPFTLSSTFTFSNIKLNAGDQVSIYVRGLDSSTYGLSNSKEFWVTGATAANDTSFQVLRKSTLERDDVYELNSVLPKEFTLLDVINDATRLFNLYYWTDNKTKTVYVEPRDSFFKSLSSSIDWTNKIDVSTYEIEYVNTYKKTLDFKYRDLNNDEWLKAWQNRNKRNYAEYKHTLPNRFQDGTSEIKLDLFSATYAVVDVIANPYDGSNVNIEQTPVTLRIWNEDVAQGLTPSERISEYNPRIYLYNHDFQYSDGGTQKSIYLEGTPYTRFGFGTFETYANVTSDINLSFTGLDGLFASYYANMIKTIEESGRLIINVNLTDSDIENMDFRKLVYIDYPSKIKGYYIVESIEDYKPNENELTKVSLFKFENLGSVAIDTSQDGNNSTDIDGSTNNNNQVNEVYIVDGGNIIDVFVVDPFTGNEIVIL